MTDKMWTDQGLESLRGLVEMVIEEHVRQLAKWGVQEKSPFEWMTNLAEEVGELAQAITEMIHRGGPHRDIVEEAIQAGTLALKIAEMAQGECEPLLPGIDPQETLFDAG